MTEPPTIEHTGSAPATINSPPHVADLRFAFEQAWSPERVIDYGTVAGSEDVSLLATASGAPLVFWITGGADPRGVRSRDGREPLRAGHPEQPLTVLRAGARTRRSATAWTRW